jgi:hypothetical protein
MFIVRKRRNTIGLRKVSNVLLEKQLAWLKLITALLALALAATKLALLFFGANETL